MSMRMHLCTNTRFLLTKDNPIETMHTHTHTQNHAVFITIHALPPSQAPFSFMPLQIASSLA